jgi:hypothetical protein
VFQASLQQAMFMIEGIDKLLPLQDLAAWQQLTLIDTFQKINSLNCVN